MVEFRDPSPSMNSAGFQFNERDAHIVHYVYQLRVATIDLLVGLTNRSRKSLERRLPKLVAEHYLRRLKPRPHKGLYVIGRAGVTVLINAGFAPDELVSRRRRQNEWKDLYIPHALHVASIRAKFMLISRQGPVQLVHWQHDDQKLWDVVETSDGKLPIRPDAYFVLQDATAGKAHFFLEADVGSMSHTRIAQKIKAYAAYHREQRHVAKLGIRYFRVAIITQTKARAANLRDELYPLMSAAQRYAYCFVHLDDLSSVELLGIADRAAA